MSRVNKNLQEIAYSWFQQNQHNLNLITGAMLWLDGLKSYFPKNTLVILNESHYSLANILRVSSGLRSITINHAQQIPLILKAAQQWPKSIQNVEVFNMYADNDVGSDELYEELRQLIKMMPSLREIEFSAPENEKTINSKLCLMFRSRYDGLKRLTMNECALIRLAKEDLSKSTFVGEEAIEVELMHLSAAAASTLQCLQLTDISIVQATTLNLFLSRFPNLKECELSIMLCYDLENIESLCQQFKTSCCDHLEHFNLELREMDESRSKFSLKEKQSRVMILLQSISTRWPQLKSFILYFNLLSSINMNEIMKLFKNVKGLQIFGSAPQRYSKFQGPLSLNSINKLSQLCQNFNIYYLCDIMALPSLKSLELMIDLSILSPKTCLKRLSKCPLTQLESLSLWMYVRESRRKIRRQNYPLDYYSKLVSRILHSCPKLKSLSLNSLCLRYRSEIVSLCSVLSKCTRLEHLVLSI